MPKDVHKVPKDVHKTKPSFNPYPPVKKHRAESSDSESSDSESSDSESSDSESSDDEAASKSLSKGKQKAPQVEREKYYLNLPGNMTGDIWHVAAAQSLARRFGRGDVMLDDSSEEEPSSDLTVKVAIGVVKTQTGKGKYEQRSPVLFEFLEALELPAKKVELSAKQSRPSVVMTNVSKTLKKKISERWDDENQMYGKYKVQGVIDQKVSTTILMHYVRQKGKQVVIEHLRQAFTEGLPEQDKQEMDAKVQQIREAIKRNGGKKVVLLNRRTGDVNKQHNTTDGIEKQIQELAAKKGMFVLGVATPNYKPGDIDLFDSQTKTGFADKRRTAYFWKEVSQLKQVHGLIGGRSGSMDIAAFMGMNAFSWDENLPKDVQYLRLLQTYPIMSIGHVDPEAKETTAKDSAYTKLKPESVNQWLEGSSTHPNIPLFSSIEAYVKELEGAGFLATYLRPG
jgi:hypothetical protein